MPRTIIIAITGMVAFSLLTIVVLYAISDEPFRYRQGFTRVHRLNIVQQQNVLDLKDNSYYIAGATTEQIFFGNKKDSLDLLIADTGLTAIQHVRLSVVNGESLLLKGSRIEIDSPFFYIKTGALPGIFRGKLDEWSAIRILSKAPFFEQGISITENSFAIQSILTEAERKVHRNVLCTVSGNVSGPHVNPTILEGQVDNFFSTMGTLRYSKKLNRLVYVYAYRNEYLAMDTSLNLLYKGKTIDNTEEAMIKPVETKEETYSLASPPAVVNWTAQVYENLLFVNSNLMASNETKETFDKVSVIDVYNLETNTYQFSFYLPDYEDIKMDNFKVVENRIIAMYDQYAISYSFEQMTDKHI